MVHILVRQGKVNLPLSQIIHAKLTLQSNNQRASVSSIDVASSRSTTIIEFNSSCEIHADISDSNHLDSNNGMPLGECSKSLIPSFTLSD